MAKFARRTSAVKRARPVYKSEKSARASLGANPKGYGTVAVKDARGRLKGHRAW
jgi:hypothetical protein